MGVLSGDKHKVLLAKKGGVGRDQIRKVENSA